MYESLRSTVNSSEWVFPASGSRRHELLQRSGGCVINSLNFTSSYSTWCNRWAHFKRYGRSRKALQAQVNWEGFERETMLFKHIPQYKVTSDGKVILLFGILLIYTVTFSMLANSGQIFFFFQDSSTAVIRLHKIKTDQTWEWDTTAHTVAPGNAFTLKRCHQPVITIEDQQ